VTGCSAETANHASRGNRRDREVRFNDKRAAIDENVIVGAQAEDVVGRVCAEMRRTKGPDVSALSVGAGKRLQLQAAYLARMMVKPLHGFRGGGVPHETLHRGVGPGRDACRYGACRLDGVGLIAKKSEPSGVLEEQILFLGGAHAGFSIEDLLSKEVYVTAVNDELSRRHGQRISIRDIPERGRAAAVAKWCASKTRADGAPIEIRRLMSLNACSIRRVTVNSSLRSIDGRSAT
jgi:hypothetical protein